MQMTLPLGDEVAPAPLRAPTAPEGIDVHSYDHVIVMFSGGKDGLACTLRLLDMGVRPELWHHRVDGGPDDDPELRWDWPCTDDYVRKVAQALDLPLYYSWREGGLTGELLKENDRTKPVHFETPDGLGKAGGLNGKIATRMRFPQVSPDLRTRWCSGVAKIDVSSAAIAGQDRFRGRRVLVVTGERAEESAARARYATFEPHRTHQPGPRAQRHVDHWRPVLNWTEAQVWDIIRRHRITPHPCYRLGFGRASCMICIFLGKDALASVRSLDPARIGTMTELETKFGCTVKRAGSITEHADAGTAFQMDPEIIRLAMSETYDGEVITDYWRMPAGAFREGGGPT